MKIDKTMIVIILLIMVAFLVVYSNNLHSLSNTKYNQQPFTKPNPSPTLILVSGNTSSGGQGTQASNVTFTGSSGNNYTANVSNGQYSIQLPNLDNYNIIVKWVGSYPWQNGISQPTQFSLNQEGAGASANINVNLKVNSPNSIITYSGTANTINNTKYSLTIIFTSSNNGQTFNGQVVNNTYSIQLPNLQGYTVQLHWQGPSNYSGACNAGTVTINVPAGGTASQGHWTC